MSSFETTTVPSFVLELEQLENGEEELDELASDGLTDCTGLDDALFDCLDRPLAAIKMVGSFKMALMVLATVCVSLPLSSVCR